MSDDIIRIDGVEYEKVAFTNTTCSGLAGSLGNGECIVALRPKRKQTGWVCSAPCGPCYQMYPRGAHPDQCPVSHLYSGASYWRPFYGKVVE